MTKQQPTLLSECAPLPRLTAEQEQALVEHARAGEDVRDHIILSLQRRVGALAAKYARPEAQEDFSDLVNSANVALLKHYQKALKSTHPYAYLWRVAQSTMINYYKGYGEHTQRERATILSLDMPRSAYGASLADLLSTGQTFEPSSMQSATHTLLRQAVANLPEKQRRVIERHYGFGQDPQSLNMMAKELSSKYHHNKALAALRTTLIAQFPQFAEGGVQ